MRDLLLVILLFAGSACGENGVLATFFNSTVFAGKEVDEKVDSIRFTWSVTPPPSPINGKYFSVRFEGMITGPVSAQYTFSAEHEDGLMLWVDDHMLIDDWSAGPVKTTYAIVNVTLTKDQPVFIKLEYYHTNGTDGEVSLFWEVPDEIDHQIIPSSAYSTNIPDFRTKEDALRKRLASGWGTWDYDNMLSHVLMPHLLGFVFGVTTESDKYTQGLVKCDCIFIPGLHSPDGSYTEIKSLKWQDVEIRIESAHDSNEDLVVLITPISKSSDVNLLVSPYLLYHSNGLLEVNDAGIFSAGVYGLNPVVLNSTTPALSTDKADVSAQFSLANGPLGFYSGSARKIEDIQKTVQNARSLEQQAVDNFGDHANLYEPVRVVLGWNGAYHPQEGIFTAVTRNWHFGYANYVLFDWDCYFGAWMMSMVDDDLTLQNIIRITVAQDVKGYIPNYSAGTYKTRDRSEPPIGGNTLLEVHKRLKQDWVVEMLFDKLLQWNRWWWEHRGEDGLMVWGSDPSPFDKGTNKMQAAKYESGLDNSPMYDGPDADFDPDTHHMVLWDVGLNGMLVRDCNALAELAGVLGRHDDQVDLKQRSTALGDLIKSKLWNEDLGLFINRRPDNLAWVPRISPTLFYPMLGNIPSNEQADYMIQHYLLNDTVFCLTENCAYGVPSISRNDPAFADNDYWRGRTWAPMSTLLYMSLVQYSSSSAVSARGALLKQSQALLFKNYQTCGHVQENYNTLTGEGCDVPNADPFYHWGALTGFMNLLDAGY